MEALFEPYHRGNLKLRNRILKSAIYEGRCDPNGFPTGSYADFYEDFARYEVGGLITGFAYVSREGRAMQPLQAGLDHPDKVPYFHKMTEAVHRHGCPVFVQIAHAGRQTLKRVTGSRPRGCSSKRSVYFRERTLPLATAEVYEKIGEFARAAQYAREAGFDGVQLHAAHGYLVHQFLLQAVNDREDEFGIDDSTGVGTAFLEKVILAVREKCGSDFPILVKVSGGTDLRPPFGDDQFRALIRLLDRLAVSAIEISYGTMDHALNIFRGDVPESLILSQNPIFGTRNPVRKALNRMAMHQYFIHKIKPFTPAYNLHYAEAARQLTGIPILSVGGFRTGDEIRGAITGNKTDLVALARPFLNEPDYILKLKKNGSYASRCTNCNKCSVMCDSSNETRCYTAKSKTNGTHR